HRSFPPHEILLSELNGAALASDQKSVWAMLAITSVYFGIENFSTSSSRLLVQSCGRCTAFFTSRRLAQKIEDTTGLTRGVSGLQLPESQNPGLQMPRACPVELHVSCYLAMERDPPRPKAVASRLQREIVRSSDERNPPRDQPVAFSPTFCAKALHASRFQKCHAGFFG